VYGSGSVAAVAHSDVLLVPRGPFARRRRNRRDAKNDGAIMIASKKEVKAEPKQETVSRARYLIGNMFAGGIAGMTVEATLFPLDTLKTRLQTRVKGQPISFKGMYRGVPATLAAFPASALFFGVYEPIKKKLEKTVPEGYSIVAHLGAAAAAGFAASMLRVPAEVVKQRMQTGEFKTMAGAIAGVVKQQGVRRGLFAGYGSFMLRDLPFDVIEFVAYEQLKLAGKTFVGGRDLNSLEMAGVGAFAGGFTGFVTTPLDVIKTRLMTQGTTGVNGKVYTGILNCATRMVREEGMGALLKGWQPRVMWITIGGSIFFGTLEQGKKMLVGDNVVVADV